MADVPHGARPWRHHCGQRERAVRRLEEKLLWPAVGLVRSQFRACPLAEAEAESTAAVGDTVSWFGQGLAMALAAAGAADLWDVGNRLEA